MTFIMKNLFLVFVFFVLTSTMFAQKNEFPRHENGLIYSDSTMSYLAHLIDSLNLKYKNCDLNKKYFSNATAKCHRFEIQALDLDGFYKQVQNGASYDELKQKYPEAFLDEELLLYKYNTTGYKGDKQVAYKTLPLSKSQNSGEYSITTENDTSSYFSYRDKNWVIWYRPYSKILPKDIFDAFYIYDDFSSKELPYEYARMIQYVDCMIDTSSSIFIKGARNIYLTDTVDLPPNIQTFFNLIRKNTSFSKFAKSRSARKSSYGRSDSYPILTKVVDSLAANNPQFQILLNAAVDEAVSENLACELLDNCSYVFGSKEKTLELKRRRFVVGGCSQDPKPRIHAMEIALLSAGTYKWNIFLRAHLDIMNDNFQRVSDAGYARQARKTYIKEIEDLGINTIDLLIGSCLYIENPSPNHYFSSTERVGRALAESKYKDEIERKILSMIEDTLLDDFNRIIAYFLFDNYNNYLTDDERWRNNNKRLDSAVSSLPDYIARRIQKYNYCLEKVLDKQYENLNEIFNIRNSYTGHDLDSLDKFWHASLQEKSDSLRMYIDVENHFKTIPYSIKPILDIKDSLLNRVRKFTFITDSLKANKLYRVNIFYKSYKSFSEKDRKEFLEFLPRKFKKLKNVNLDEVLYFTVNYDSRMSEEYEWLVFPDGRLMLWKYCCREKPFLNYTEEQIRVKNEGSGIQVFKYFDSEGRIYDLK